MRGTNAEQGSESAAAEKIVYILYIYIYIFIFIFIYLFILILILIFIFIYIYIYLYSSIYIYIYRVKMYMFYLFIQSIAPVSGNSQMEQEFKNLKFQHPTSQGPKLEAQTAQNSETPKYRIRFAMKKQRLHGLSTQRILLFMFKWFWDKASHSCHLHGGWWGGGGGEGGVADI